MVQLNKAQVARWMSLNQICENGLREQDRTPKLAVLPVMQVSTDPSVPVCEQNLLDLQEPHPTPQIGIIPQGDSQQVDPQKLQQDFQWGV